MLRLGVDGIREHVETRILMLTPSRELPFHQKGGCPDPISQHPAWGHSTATPSASEGARRSTGHGTKKHKEEKHQC